MLEFQIVRDASLGDRLASATENLERMRRVIGPYMPVRKSEEPAKDSEWKSSDTQEDCCVRTQK